MYTYKLIEAIIETPQIPTILSTSIPMHSPSHLHSHITCVHTHIYTQATSTNLELCSQKPKCILFYNPWPHNYGKGCTDFSL